MLYKWRMYTVNQLFMRDNAVQMENVYSKSVIYAGTLFMRIMRVDRESHN